MNERCTSRHGARSPCSASRAARVRPSAATRRSASVWITSDGRATVRSSSPVRARRPHVHRRQDRSRDAGRSRNPPASRHARVRRSHRCGRSGEGTVGGIVSRRSDRDLSIASMKPTKGDLVRTWAARLILVLSVTLTALAGAPSMSGDRTVKAQGIAESGSALVTVPFDPSRWSLEWADEFEQGLAPDPRNWSYEVGYVRNKEEQYLHERPARERSNRERPSRDRGAPRRIRRAQDDLGSRPHMGQTVAAVWPD